MQNSAFFVAYVGTAVQITLAVLQNTLGFMARSDLRNLLRFTHPTKAS